MTKKQLDTMPFKNIKYLKVLILFLHLDFAYGLLKILIHTVVIQYMNTIIAILIWILSIPHYLQIVPSHYLPLKFNCMSSFNKNDTLSSIIAFCTHMYVWEIVIGCSRL